MLHSIKCLTICGETNMSLTLKDIQKSFDIASDTAPNYLINHKTWGFILRVSYSSL